MFFTTPMLLAKIYIKSSSHSMIIVD